MENKIKRVSILAVLLTTIMISGGAKIYADTARQPEPFEVRSEDGTMVFRWNPKPDELGSLRLAHASMYRNGERLWLIDSIPAIGVSEYSFFFSDDFRFMVFTATWCKITALGFFEDGVLIRSYRIDDLVRDMSAVGYTVSNAIWENRMFGRYYDTVNNHLTIVTRDGITYIFDITTGKIIYDTVGDRPFVPHSVYSWDFRFHETPLPLWAQVTPSSWVRESIEKAGDLVLPLVLAIIAVPFALWLRANKRL